MNEIVAIMMTDIVGFTKLTRQKGDLVRKISSKHKNILLESITRYSGRFIHIFGDSSLSVFSDPIDTVKCSIEIQLLVNEEATDGIDQLCCYSDLILISLH